MNKLPRPKFNDFLVLRSLSTNKNLKSFPHLKSSVLDIRSGYRNYLDVEGDPTSIASVRLSPDVKKYLKKHYSSPPNELDVINQLRDESESDPCPMCGSFTTGTLDHFLPKKDFPEFAIFTANLVPACKCNTRRGRKIHGTNVGERFLHPYFDSCLSNRLVQAVFENPGSTPVVSTRLVLNSDHAEYPAAKFHHSHIAKKTKMHGYLRKRWLKMCKKPSIVVRALKNDPPSRLSLARTLRDELYELDEEYEGKNNWKSVFVYGLLRRPVYEWLWTNLNAPGRGNNEPLI